MVICYIKRNGHLWRPSLRLICGCLFQNKLPQVFPITAFSCDIFLPQMIVCVGFFCLCVDFWPSQMHVLPTLESYESILSENGKRDLKRLKTRSWETTYSKYHRTDDEKSVSNVFIQVMLRVWVIKELGEVGWMVKLVEIRQI
jgi:hypothetical protein